MILMVTIKYAFGDFQRRNFSVLKHRPLKLRQFQPRFNGFYLPMATDVN